MPSTSARTGSMRCCSRRPSLPRSPIDAVNGSGKFSIDGGPPVDTFGDLHPQHRPRQQRRHPGPGVPGRRDRIGPAGGPRARWPARQRSPSARRSALAMEAVLDKLPRAGALTAGAAGKTPSGRQRRVPKIGTCSIRWRWHGPDSSRRQVQARRRGQDRPAHAQEVPEPPPLRHRDHAPTSRWPTSSRWCSTAATSWCATPRPATT